ncbi:hypothetical protein [Sphingomonas sp.]|uniref:hypothetical protein n=1 Tax=Sphingomonas sp. TaxID=28214 RepID=UPI00286E8676|nr:hypothetical protein [Sphingomonas sp.]
MRALILLAGAALTLSACGETDSPTDDMNVTTENVAIDDNAMLGNEAGGLDANAATNSEAEANLVANDLTTNDADTNLANGL